MIFVIGGAYQGKTTFVMEHLGIKEQDILDGTLCSYESILKAKAIKHFERLIDRLMKEEKDITMFIKDLLQRNQEILIVMAEVGSGLVPIDEFDRAYREKVGRVGCELAKQAQKVYRVQYGIGTKIYESSSTNNPKKSECNNQMKVYVLRHSITKGNLEKRFVGSTDESLCEEGITLAKSKHLPPVDKVYVSPMLRCLQTADIIYKDKERAVISGLRETSFGDFEYKNYEELNGNAEYQKWIDSNAKSGFPNGESFEEANERAKTVFCQIIKDAYKNGYEKIAIVTHGGTIMGIMSAFSQEKKEYFEWKAKNCEGYLLEINGGSACYQS